jgi:hypothetical protein
MIRLLCSSLCINAHTQLRVQHRLRTPLNAEHHWERLYGSDREKLNITQILKVSD